MEPEDEVTKLLKQAVELKLQGNPDSAIIESLREDGVPAEVAPQIVDHVNVQIASARSAARASATRKVAALQAACLVICPLSVWAFIELMALPGNLVPLNLGPVNVVDSVLLTLLGSVAATAFFTFFMSFRAYFD